SLGGGPAPGCAASRVGVPGGAFPRRVVTTAVSETGMTRCWPTFSGASVLGSLFDLTIAATVTPYFLASEVSVSPAFTPYTRCAARGPAAGPAWPSAGPKATTRLRLAAPSRAP